MGSSCSSLDRFCKIEDKTLSIKTNKTIEIILQPNALVAWGFNKFVIKYVVVVVVVVVVDVNKVSVILESVVVVIN